MRLKIQRSVNIFTISAADIDAVARLFSCFLTLSVCLSVSRILHLALVTLYFFFFCTLALHSLILSRSLDIAFLLLPWQILIFFSFFYLLPTSSFFSLHLFHSYLLTYLLSSWSFYLFVSISLASHSSIWRLNDDGVEFCLYKKEKEKHFRFVQFSECVFVRYHHKPNKCTFPVVRFLLPVYTEN